MGWGDPMAAPPLGTYQERFITTHFFSARVFCNPPSCKSEPLQKPAVSLARQLHFRGAELPTGSPVGSSGDALIIFHHIF